MNGIFSLEKVKLEKVKPGSLYEIRHALLDATPLSLSILLFGAIFGTLSIHNGLSAWQSIAMSLVVFAGSAQFASLSMLAEHTSIWSIILTTFLLNSRQFLYGISVSPNYVSFSKLFVNISAFFLTDEQFAITLNRSRHNSIHKAYILTVSFTLYLSWVVGTWVGTIAGNWLPDPNALGLGFSFTATFIALAYYQLTSLLRIFTFLFCGGVAVLLAFFLPNGLNLVVAGIVAFMIGYFTPSAAYTREVKAA